MGPLRSAARRDLAHAARLLRACAAYATLGLVGACGEASHAPLVGGIELGGQAPTGAELCVDGTTRACGVVLREHDGVADCMQATQVCHGTAWGVCGERGPVTTKSVPAAASAADGDGGGGGGLSTKSLGSPSSCLTDPCDPYCQTFVDTTDGGLALDGLVYADGGGLTLPGSTSDAAAISSALGSAFGSKANVDGACARSSDCNVDQHCVIPTGATTGSCASWGPGQFDATCQPRATTLGALTPSLTCKGQDPSGSGDFFGAVSSALFDPTFSAPPLFVGVASPSSLGTALTQRAGGELAFFDTRGATAACNLRLVLPLSSGATSDPDGLGATATRFAEEAEPLLVDLNGDGVPEVLAWDRNSSVVAYAPSTGAAYVQRRLLAYSVAKLPGALTYTAAPYAGFRDPDGVVGRAWQSTRVGSGWLAGSYAALVPLGSDAGLGALDLDGDGRAEIVTQSGYVFSASGQLLAMPPLPSGLSAYDVVEAFGAGPVLGNLDGDANVELVLRSGVYEYVAGAGWRANPGTTWPTLGGAPIPPTAPAAGSAASTAFAGLADFGAFGADPSAPEIVWVSGGAVYVLAGDGAPVFGFPAGASPAPPSALAGVVSIPGGGGGPPTIADFDGDGLPEIGVAGSSYYSMFDPDCVSGTPRTYTRGGVTLTGTCNRTGSCDCLAGGDCVAGGPDAKCALGVLWSRRTQDQGPTVTGSTAFDFDADGRSEVVYADECWTRVFDGASGAVLQSTQHSSATLLEQPIVADVDLDGRADLLVSNERAGETTAGEGMFCPSRVVSQAPLGIGNYGGGVGFFYSGKVTVEHPGQPVSVRWSGGGGQACLVPQGTSTARCAPASASATGFTSWLATVAIPAGDPSGIWNVFVAPAAWPFPAAQDLWLQGLALGGATGPATVSGASTGLGTDALFAGLACATSADCPTRGMPCDAASHLCRCASDAQCGQGARCVDSTGGLACRPTRAYGPSSGVTGVQVWSGVGGEWAASRYVWSEHAYVPAHVKDDASIKPRAACEADEASAWNPSSASGASTNSYRRQTAYAGAPAGGLPDLTVPYPCDPQNVQVCNRGAGVAPPGALLLEFPGNASKFSFDTSASTIKASCLTTQPILPGQCLTVPCPHSGGATGEWVIDPTCHADACASNADCGAGTTGVCDPTTGFCGVSTCNASVPTKGGALQCARSDGDWSFVQGNTGAYCATSSAVPASAAFTRVFQAAPCLAGTRSKWGLFSYATADPLGTNVVFSFQTGPDVATATTAPATLVATAGYAPIGASTGAGPTTCQLPADGAFGVTCPIDLSAKIAPNDQAVLIMTATLDANTSTAQAPTLLSWNVTYDCVPSE